jgi:hypothetical protein
MLSTLVIAGVTIILQLIIASYTYGKLTNEVVNLKSNAKDVNKQVDDHETRISRLEGAMN